MYPSYFILISTCSKISFEYSFGKNFVNFSNFTSGLFIKLNKFEPSFKSGKPILSKYSFVSFLGVNLIFFKIVFC